jgi:Holliday junction resolvasome RuvABC endonuclease subunit
VGHARAEQVAFMVQENLGFVDQAPKGRGMDDAVAVALKGVAIGRCGFGEAPAAGARGV